MINFSYTVDDFLNELRALAKPVLDPNDTRIERAKVLSRIIKQFGPIRGVGSSMWICIRREFVAQVREYQQEDDKRNV